ncbi:hypothetical protein GLAREA_06990 [Glarea lozoyensis ATCC 20868]|uniref:Uncharacterized protein n=1 Tax=Glarea lozoyensis (strain ATCC 20868 / MF5171) TaxID=1116229 RepID=S3D673_GLAL2|nr:uncharacterized protein GLAREA_06990 [Glarea lozoyensis ATCC 20868]EPE33977.1 hypothetical protein GLAREA_06990 [Glarea lozoyensis ATCC 20868]
MAYSGKQFEDNEPSPMFEFNQHDSTLDPTRIINWIQVCVALIKDAHELDPEDRTLKVDLNNDVELRGDTRTFLRRFGLDHSVVDFYAPKISCLSRREERRMRRAAKAKEPKQLGNHTR